MLTRLSPTRLFLAVLVTLALLGGVVLAAVQARSEREDELAAFAAFSTRQAFASVSVNRGKVEFESEIDGKVTFDQQEGTFFRLAITGAGGGSGCFKIPDADFTGSLGSGAELHTTVGGPSTCPAGTLVSATSAALGEGSNVDALVEPSATLLSPTRVDLVWSKPPVLRTSESSNQFSCLDFSESTQVRSTSGVSRATGTITGVDLSRLIRHFALVSVSSAQFEREGRGEFRCFQTR